MLLHKEKNFSLPTKLPFPFWVHNPEESLLLSIGYKHLLEKLMIATNFSGYLINAIKYKPSLYEQGTSSSFQVDVAFVAAYSAMSTDKKRMKVMYRNISNGNLGK